MVLAQQADEVCMDYATLKTQGLHYSDAFAQGNIAMLNMGSWFIGTLINKIASGEYTDCANWGMVKYPHAEGVEAGSTLATITALALPVSAPHKDEAWDFIKFVTGAEGAEVLAATGTIPAMTNDAVIDLISFHSRKRMPASVSKKLFSRMMSFSCSIYFSIFNAGIHIVTYGYLLYFFFLVKYTINTNKIIKKEYFEFSKLFFEIYLYICNNS